MKQILKKIDFIQIVRVLAVVIMLVFPLVTVHAQLQVGNTSFCNGTGLNCNAGTNVNSLIRTIINWLLGIAMAVAVLFLIIGGFQYITSAGNEEAAEKGKGTAINALIGIVIIILSYVIVNVVANLVTNGGSTTGNNGGF